MIEPDGGLPKDRKYLMGLALRISKAREKKFGKSRGSKTRAAEAYGVSLPDWHSTENCRNEPRASKLLNLARFLEVDPGWLLSGNGNMNPVQDHVEPERQDRLELFESQILRDPPKSCPNAGVCLRQARILKLLSGMIGAAADDDAGVEVLLNELQSALLKAAKLHRGEAKQEAQMPPPQSEVS